MPKIFAALPLLFFTFSAYTQSLNGLVIDAKSRERIPGTHVINKRSMKGTMTNAEGEFQIDLKWGDTIIFSNIAYKYYYFIYQDSSSALEDVLIRLSEQNYLLSEVSIFSYKLTSNKDREMEIKPARTPPSKDLSDGRIVQATPMQPAEFLYNLFGSKPRQLRMLAQLKAEDYYRELLNQNANRKSVVRITGLKQEELEAFMFYCKYSPVYMQTLNDYEFLKSVQACYKSYVKEKELEDFLNQFD